MKRYLIASAFALLAPSAFAHAMLESDSPQAGATVESPAEIRITFFEGIEPKFSGVDVSGPGGAVPVGKASVQPGDDKVLIVKVGKKLAPGTYSVKWHAVSIDTHHTQGHFEFTVK